MASVVKLILPRRLEAIQSLLDSLENLLVEADTKRDVRLAALLVAEELFTNLVRHDRGGEETISVSFEIDGPRLQLTMRHSGVERPEIPRAGTIDVAAPLDARSPGGLGVHLVRAMVDKLDYDYRGDTLTVTATKNLEPPDVRHRT